MRVEADMDAPSEDEKPTGDRESAAARKAAERQRLAEALRANLGRRKAQCRERNAHESAEKEGQKKTD